jgi:acetyl esterase/lipase
MPLDPDNAAFLEAAARKPAKPLSETSVAEMRAGVEALIPLGFDREDVASTRDDTVDGVLVRTYRPVEEIGVTVLWLHGGSFTRCGLHTHDTLLRRFANRSGCEVVAPDYTLAPEARYPRQLDEAGAVARWLARRDPDKRRYLAGESSGGCLAAASALRERDRGELVLDGLLLVLPVLDRDSRTTSRRELAADYMLTDEQMHWMFDQYAPDAAADDAYAQPFRATDLSGLPHTMVVTAEYDPLRDEGEAFATRVRDAGGSAEDLRIPGITHHAVLVPQAIPAGADVIDRAAALVRAHATTASNRV